MNTVAEKGDRRARRTRRALQRGLAALLLQKNIKDITVRELCELADLHRGTFYLHYRDIYDLYAQIEQEAAAEVSAILTSYAPTQGSGARHPAPYPMILRLLEYIAENAEVSRMLLSANSGMAFVATLAGIIRDRCVFDLQGALPSGDPTMHSVFGSFVVTGCVGVVRTWLEGGMPQPPEQLARMIEQISLRGASCLLPEHGVQG